MHASNLVSSSLGVAFHTHSARKPTPRTADTTQTDQCKKGDSLTSVLGQYENHLMKSTFSDSPEKVFREPGSKHLLAEAIKARAESSSLPRTMIAWRWRAPCFVHDGRNRHHVNDERTNSERLGRARKQTRACRDDRSQS